MYFSFDIGKYYLFTKIYVLVNEMKCFVFLGGVMFKIFWGSQIPMTTRGFCTESGVIENWKKRNVFILLYIYIVICLHCYFRAVLWSCTCWYCIAGIPLLSRFLHFLVLTHNRGEWNHSYKLLNTFIQQNQPTMPINH